MSGAPVLITLYRNGIHVAHGNPDFIVSPELQALLRQALASPSEPSTAVDRLLTLVAAAIDSVEVEDREGEDFPGTPVAFSPQLPSTLTHAEQRRARRAKKHR